MLETLKSLIRDQLGLPPQLVLMMAGGLAHLALNSLLRKPLTSAWGLLAPVLLGVALESYEIWTQYRELGLLAPGNDPPAVILARHLRDVVLICSIPLVLVTVGFFRARSG